MADLSYDSYLNSNKKTKKSSATLSYDTYLQKQNIITQKQELIKQGLPVSVKDNRVAPTTVGNFIRGALMPVADVGVNLLNTGRLIIGKEEKPIIKNNYLGDIKGLGKVDITKSPLSKENLKVIGKSVATGLELGSYASGGGAVIGTGKNVVKQGVKEFLKTSGKQLAKEGALTSALGSIGYQGREGKVDPLVVARDTAIGTVAAPLLGAGFNKLLGKNATKVVESIPENMPNSNIINKGLNKVEISETPKIDPIQTKIPQIENTSVLKEQIFPKQNKTQIEIPEEIIKKDTQTMSNQIEGFDEGTFKQWSSDIRNLDIEEIKRVALGGEKTIQNTIPKNAYLSIAKNIANETKDIKLAQELATSNVSSKGGQELVASKLAVGDNIVDDLVDIKKSILKRKGMSIDKLATEEQVLLTKIKSKVKEMTDTIPTKQEFEDIINSLICK